MRGPHEEECVILAWGQQHIPQCYFPRGLESKPLPAYLSVLWYSHYKIRIVWSGLGRRGFLKDDTSICQAAVMKVLFHTELSSGTFLSLT